MTNEWVQCRLLAQQVAVGMLKQGTTWYSNAALNASSYY
jgi:hypothetical protein